MTLPRDKARCHGLRMAKRDPPLPQCWACQRRESLSDMGPLTTVLTPIATITPGLDGIARVSCPDRIASVG